MFTSLDVPPVQGRRALLIINCTRSVFEEGGSPKITNTTEMVDRIKKVLPYYRKLDTDVVWVKTDVAIVTNSDGKDGTPAQSIYDIDSYMPSSHYDSAITQQKGPTVSAEVKALKGRTANLQARMGSDEIAGVLADLVEPEKDLIISKEYYSAFDETPLLMGLRMRMITTVHLCGLLSNVSIMHTAADAAQHGFEVGVLEDCMGYLGEEEHLEGMKRMADSVGVHGVDSEEIIEEAGGRAPPEASPDLLLGPGISAINISADDKPDQFDEKSKSENAEPWDRNLAKAKRKQRLQTSAHKGPIGEGDSDLYLDALPTELAANGFVQLKKEVEWQTMVHRTGEVPRRVAVQGEIGDDGSVPVYRHPADESPPLNNFTPTVLRIRDECSRLLNQPFNHVLVQLYRSGQDNISEHSDKTLDIARHSSIVNVSLGAERAMTLRLKKEAAAALSHPKELTSTSRKKQGEASSREKQKIPLPHNSVFVLGPKSNARWLHGIRPDKRLESERSEAEKAYGGERISLTFRYIATFTDPKRTRIWGQGARNKTKTQAGLISPSDTEESEKMIVAFGKENQLSTFDWDTEYGSGFDALDLVVVNRPTEATTT